MEYLIMDLIDCLKDCIPLVDDSEMRQHILNTIKAAEGRLEYQQLIAYEANQN